VLPYPNFGIKPVSRTVDIAQGNWKSGRCYSDIRNNASKQLTPYGRYPISRATMATMATMAMARPGFHDTNFVAPKAQQRHRPRQKVNPLGSWEIQNWTDPIGGFVLTMFALQTLTRLFKLLVNIR